MAEFGLLQAFDLVKAWFVAQGSELEHQFGSEWVKKPGSPNSYIWVPLKAEKIGRDLKRALDQHKGIWQAWQYVAIRCWGESHDVAYCMASNVGAALVEVLGSPNVDYGGGVWDDATEEESPVAKGRVFIAQFAVLDVMAQRYVPIAKYAGTPQTPIGPDVPTTQLTGFEVEILSVDNDQDAGESGGTDVAVPPPPP
jgi:hypothetical protein